MLAKGGLRREQNEFDTRQPREGNAGVWWTRKPSSHEEVWMVMDGDKMWSMIMTTWTIWTDNVHLLSGRWLMPIANSYRFS